MADQKLTDRQSLGTSSSDSSIHIVQGGTSYKQSKGNFLKEINTRIDENQYSGVIVYELYSTLLGVTGVLNTSYKVTNDPDTALNGYYHWTGSAYVKDANLVSSVLDIADTAEGLSGKAVYDYVKKSKYVTIVYDEPTDFINFNTVSNTIEFPASFFVSGIDFFGYTRINSLADIAYVDEYIIKILYFDLVSRTVGVADFSDSSYNLDPQKSLLATFVPTKGTFTSNGFDIGIDGIKQNTSQNELFKKNTVSLTLFNESDYINFNFIDNQIEFPSTFYIIGQNSINYDAFYGLSPLSVTAGFTLGVLWYDSGTRGLGVSDINDSDYHTDYTKQVVATFLPSNKTVTTNGFKYRINDEDSTGVSVSYNEITQRLLVPDKIFIADYPLKIYKESLTASKLNQDNNLIALKTERDTLLIEPNLIIDDSLPSSVTIVQTPKVPNGYFYRKDVAVVTTDPTTKSGAKSILCLGDSLTNRGIAARTKTKIELISSVALTPIGTMSNDEGASGEGREGWEFSNFIGKDNTHSTGTIIRQTSAGSSSLLLNPFLKLADATDKSTNPDWCFTNTGSNLETSYTINPALGDYYIFDWDFYFTTQAITAPDVLTIALSTNDLTFTPNDWLENCSLGLEIMLKQLNTYCVDNTLNINVGVIPTPAWGLNTVGATQWSLISEWTEKALFDVNSYTFSNIVTDVVAVWMHQNGQSNFEDGNSVVGNIQTYSTVKKINYGGYIHFDTEAKNQYADILSAYVINKL